MPTESITFHQTDFPSNQWTGGNIIVGTSSAFLRHLSFSNSRWIDLGFFYEHYEVVNFMFPVMGHPGSQNVAQLTFLNLTSRPQSDFAAGFTFLPFNLFYLFTF